MKSTIVAVKGLTKSYSRGGEELRVLDGLNLEMAEGGFFALMGPSGSGKTTLLNLVGGLDRADSGQVLVADEDIGGMSGGQLAAWRARTLGFVFQGVNPIPLLTALEKGGLPLQPKKLPRRGRTEDAADAL